jgi:hypothetical protein
MPSIKLGELLIKANVLNESQLKAALAEQHKWGGKLGDILVRMSLVTEDVLVRALSKQLGIQAANLESVQGIPPHVRSKVPAAQCKDLMVVPLMLKDEGKTLVVAMAEPQNLSHLDTLRAVSKCRIVSQLGGRTAIARAFVRFYDGEADISDGEASFKVLDSQGNTVVKNISEVQAPGASAPPGPAPAPAAPPVLRQTGPKFSLSDIPAQKSPSSDPHQLLRSVEDTQRREVAALKAMVELMIEKGIFTREEYVAKVKRSP